MARCVFTSPGRSSRFARSINPQRKDVMGSHDSGYKLLFSYPYLVESLIRGFVPGSWIGNLDFSSLEPVREAHPSDEIGVRYNDMIWRLRWRDSGEWIYIYLMLEFQSTVQQFMAVRVFDYDGGLYRQIVRALRPKHDDKLPIVLPLVLYRGDRKWTAKQDVFDLIAPAPAEIAPYLPHLRYLLLDVNALPVDELESMRNPAACLFWLEGLERLSTEPIVELDEILSRPNDEGLRRTFATWLTTNYLQSRMADTNVPIKRKLEEVVPMIEANKYDWTAEWREEGLRKGLREGRREGEAEGRRKGEADLLLRQLGRLYGSLSPAIEDRVRTAGAEQLLEWGERLVTTGSLEEVFGRDRDD